jgi:hypothetical protein
VASLQADEGLWAGEHGLESEDFEGDGEETSGDEEERSNMLESVGVGKWGLEVVVQSYRGVLHVVDFEAGENWVSLCSRLC